MNFKDKVVVITGGAQGIGRCIAEEFEKLGATVCVIDKQQGDHFVGDSRVTTLWAILQINSCWNGLPKMSLRSMGMWTISSTMPCH